MQIHIKHRTASIRLPLTACIMSEVQEIAKEAYLFLYPTIETYKVMYAQVLMSDGRPGCFNTFTHNTELAGPTDTTIVSPNNDTLYSAAWLDLRNGPVMLTVPRAEKDSRYYCVLLNDAFTSRNISRWW